jgi:DNA-binding transcriptional LysR family regulator
MHVDQLRYFRTVIRIGSISRAADELGLTQPALSRALARLEREVGAALLLRQSRPLALTRQGKVFLVRVERALDELDAAQSEIADQLGNAPGMISIGFLRSLGASFVPTVVRDFLRTHPDTRFTFMQNNSALLEAQLLAGEIALCITARMPHNPAIAWSQIGTQPLGLIVPADHRLARRRSVRLNDVRGETFISFKPGHAVRDFTDDLCRRAGFEPTSAFEAEESSSIRGFVAAGFGIALVPLTGGHEDHPRVAVLDSGAKRPIGVMWLGDRYLSTAEVRFRTYLCSQPLA